MPDQQHVPMPPHGLLGLEPEPLWIRYDWVLWLILILIVLLFVWIIYRWARGSKKIVELPPSPWIGLENELNQWEAVYRDRPSGDVYLGLSGVLRHALELKHSFPATGQTLPELRRSLVARATLSADVQQELLEFLSLADQVKFAGQTMTPEETGAWIERMRSWLKALQGDRALVSKH